MKLIAAITVLLAAQLVAAPPPKLVREIDLNQIIPGRPGYLPFPYFAFSPDEKWLAVTFGALPTDPRKRLPNGRQVGTYTLLLMPVNGPADQQVQIDPGLRPLANPGWSPSSDTFFVPGLAANARNSRTDGIVKVWNLRGEELFRRTLLDIGPPGGIFGFLDPEHLLVRGGSTRKRHEFEILDLHGKVVDTWTVPKHWRVVDISPDRHLLAVLSDEQAAQTLVVDYPSKQVVLAKDNPYDFLLASGGSGEYFTEDGRTLCSVGSVGDPQFDTVTECWDVDSGKRIAKFDGFLGGAPAAASSHGSRLVLTNNAVLPKRSAALVYFHAERVVWDFRAGTEFAAWDTPQTVVPNPSHIHDSVVISSTGRYVAETVGALLRIYEIP